MGNSLYKSCFSVNHIRPFRRLVGQDGVSPIVVSEMRKSWFSPFRSFYVILHGCDVETGGLNVGVLTRNRNDAKMNVTIEAAKVWRFFVLRL